MKESYLMMLLEKTSLIVVLFLLISKLKIFNVIKRDRDDDLYLVAGDNGETYKIKTR